MNELKSIEEILKFSDVHPKDCCLIKGVVNTLHQENTKLKERISYLERSNNRKEEQIINYRLEENTIIQELTIWLMEQDGVSSNSTYEEVLTKLQELKGDKHE